MAQRLSSREKFIAACRSGDAKTVRHLIAAILSPKSVINSKDDMGWTGLMLAATRGHVEVEHVLLESEHTNCNACDENGNTALIWACKVGRIEMVDLLLNAPGVLVCHKNVFKKQALDYAENAQLKERLKVALATERQRMEAHLSPIIQASVQAYMCNKTNGKRGSTKVLAPVTENNGKRSSSSTVAAMPLHFSEGFAGIVMSYFPIGNELGSTVKHSIAGVNRIVHEEAKKKGPGDDQHQRPEDTENTHPVTGSSTATGPSQQKETKKAEQKRLK
jgi:ankyrin repeat protein